MGKYIKYTKEQLEQANQVDLTEFLKQHGEGLEKSGKEMRWAKYSSVTIRGNRWFQHKYQEGGYPIQFLQKFYDYTFQEAVNALLEGSPTLYEAPVAVKREFHAPGKSGTMKRLYGYLLKQRCIDYEVLRAFIQKGLIYESDGYHNIVFAGFDEEGEIKHAHKRSTSGSYRANELGSDPKYCFHWTGTSNRIKVFEAPIDLLSYISLHKVNWEADHYVALNGISPQALMHQLHQNSGINEVTLCLDHDIAGNIAMSRIQDELEGKYFSLKIDKDLSKNKDWNEDLKELVKQEIGHKGIDNPMTTMYGNFLRDLKHNLIMPEQSCEIKEIMNQYMDFYSMSNRQSTLDYQKLCDSLAALSMKAMKYYQQLAGTAFDPIEKMIQSYYVYQDRGSIVQRKQQLEYTIDDLKMTYIMEDPTRETLLQKRLLDVANCSMQLYMNYVLCDQLEKIKEGIDVEQNKKPKCPMINANGNIFNLLMVAGKSLEAVGQLDNAREMNERVMTSHSYYDAINIITEYVVPTTAEEINEKVYMELAYLKEVMRESGLEQDYQNKALMVMTKSKTVEHALEMINQMQDEMEFASQMKMIE